jgi:hypothetical protein
MKILSMLAVLAAIAFLAAPSSEAEARSKGRETTSCTSVTGPDGRLSCVAGFRLSGGHRYAPTPEPYIYRRFYGFYPQYDNRTFHERVFPYD